VNLCTFSSQYTNTQCDGRESEREVDELLALFYTPLFSNLRNVRQHAGMDLANSIQQPRGNPAMSNMHADFSVQSSSW
jgi:hypothetical protein